MLLGLGFMGMRTGLALYDCTIWSCLNACAGPPLLMASWCSWCARADRRPEELKGHAHGLKLEALIRLSDQPQPQHHATRGHTALTMTLSMSQHILMQRAAIARGLPSVLAPAPAPLRCHRRHQAARLQPACVQSSSGQGQQQHPDYPQHPERYQGMQEGDILELESFLRMFQAKGKVLQAWMKGHLLKGGTGGTAQGHSKGACSVQLGISCALLCCAGAASS